MSKDLALEQVEWDLHENNVEIIPLEFTEEVKPELYGLELVKAQEMTSGLSTTIAEREVLKKSYADVIELEITTDTLPIFKELRLKIVKNRTQGIEKWHTTNKAFYLAGGRFVDAIKNKEIVVNQEMESKLLEAEKYFENLEKEKAKLLNESRIEKLTPYVDDITGLDFSPMTDEDFDDYLLGKKTRFENEQKEKLEAEQKAEAERLAEVERQKAIELENAKLKAEAELKEKALAEERKLQAEKEAKLKAEADAKLKTEQEAKAKLEAELKSKKDAELKAESERLAKIESDKKEADKLAKAPVKKQLQQWVNSFEISTPIIENDLSLEIAKKFEAFKKWSLTEIEKL